MKKMICLVTAILVFCSMVLPVAAVEGEFVPSISYKDGPTVEKAELDGEGVGDCVVVTSIIEAKNKSTDITQEERDLLLEVYEALKDGSMKLPLDGDYVIRDLVDVSFEHDDCRIIEEHGHKDEQLKKPETTLTVDFDLGVGKGTEVIVMVYIDGQWQKVENVTNNGNGTITCVFEDICPVAFVVEGSQEDSIPKTGDMMGQSMMLWMGIMAVCAAALVIVARKKA